MSDPDIQCDDCNRRFVDASALWQHRKWKHCGFAAGNALLTRSGEPMLDRTIEANPLELDLDAMPVAEQAVAVRTETALSTPAQAPAMPSSVNVGVLLTAMLEKASDPNLDKDKFIVLKDTVKEFAAAEAERAFNWDMSLAQAEMYPVVRATEVRLVKDGKDLGGYKHADHADLDEMIRPIYTKYGFSITYDRKARQGDGGGFVVIGTLRHRGGHSITAEFPIALDSGPGRSNAQAAGSTDQYGRKYILLGFFNIIRKGEDDDGVAAGGLPITFDEAAQIKQLVDEAGIDNGMEGDERKRVIVEWFNDMLGYALPKGYASIKQEDGVRVRRALLSLKAKRLTSRQKEVQI